MSIDRTIIFIHIQKRISHKLSIRWIYLNVELTINNMNVNVSVEGCVSTLYIISQITYKPVERQTI